MFNFEFPLTKQGKKMREEKERSTSQCLHSTGSSSAWFQCPGFRVPI